ncbi:hypothetical protein Tco_0029311 [Tanacetum coccineum]
MVKRSPVLRIRGQPEWYPCGSVVSNPKINRDSVIIEDWTSDDEEEVSRVQKVRPENQTVKTRDDKSGQNSHKQRVGFRKVKACLHRPSINIARSVCTARPSINTAWPSINIARPVSTVIPSISTAKPSVSIARPSVSTTRHVYATRPTYPRDHAVMDSGCSSHMTGNKAYLSDYEDFNGGFVAFGSDPKGG